MTVDNSFTMKKFQSMEIIYVTFSQITKLPYVECDPETFDDQVYMFTEEEAAKEFAKSYVEKNTPLLTVKVLRKQMPKFYINERNVMGIMDELSEAQRHIEQNVNARMVFFDFSLKMIVLLKQ